MNPPWAGTAVEALVSLVVGFKTVAPSLDGTIERPAALISLRRATATAKWLSGPSGSGKSTLVASQLKAGGKQWVWYRLDARDNDPAFFYANLAATIERSISGVCTLPVFADDDRERELGFAERFFAAVVRECGDVAFVFDDAHKVERELIQEALAAFVALEGVEIWFVGEEVPPVPFFDAISSRRLALCNEVRLAFDVHECESLAETLRLGSVSGADLAAMTGGHAGALVLACELLRGTQLNAPITERIVAKIHRHLLARLLERMPHARSELLLRTCLAPQVNPAIVRELVGDAAVADLETLCAQGLLRTAMTERGAIYEVHGLVRRGLETLLRERLGPEGSSAWAMRTAAVLEAQGFDEDAFTLLADCAAFEHAAALLERTAERYARRRQADLLSRACTRLPESAVDARPWLCFWAGQSLLGVDEESARRWFERAYAAFERTGDANGMRVAAARVVMAFGLEYGDLRALDAWIERHDRAGGNDPISPGTAYESVLSLGAICVAMIRGAHPSSADPDSLVHRLRVLIDDDSAWLAPDEPVIAARLLIDHGRIFTTPDRAQGYVLETRARAERVDTSSLQRGRWNIAAAWAYYVDGQHPRAQEHLDEARRLTEQCGSPRLAFELGMALVDAALKRNDLGTAASELSTLESLAKDAPPAQRAEHARITARTMLLQNRLVEGLRWAEQAIETAKIAGYSGAHARDFQVEQIYAFAANERFEEALERADRLLEELGEQQGEVALIIRDALRFFVTDGKDMELLADVLNRAEALGFVNLLSRARAPIARLCQIALSHDLHAGFVRRLIGVQRLPPPLLAGPEWPWHVYIRTLGSFELTIAGERYRPQHKTQDKPLELLKLLVTCQAFGRDSADREWIAERLWPDADVTNARKSLDMTLSRLRKLLKDDDAIVLSEGRLRFSSTRVWTDLTPLMRALRHASARRAEVARGAMPAVSAAVADITAVLDHYRGRYLPEEGDAPWLIAGREAVAAAVRSALLIADTVLDGREDDRLIAALESALAADPTSEDLARALMRAFSRRGQHTETIRVYRRLREMLSIILSLPPSRETEQLKDDLYAKVSAGDTKERADRIVQGRASP
jgi:ATP/maltotriose-dependent transcriptional regulator MalT/DNA-binding SARP family transcriptional activator